MWDGDAEFLSAVLEGWALGDGCVSDRGNGWSPRTTVVTTSHDLAWQMRLEEQAQYLEALTGKKVVALENMEDPDDD